MIYKLKKVLEKNHYTSSYIRQPLQKINPLASPSTDIVTKVDRDKSATANYERRFFHRHRGECRNLFTTTSTTSQFLYLSTFVFFYLYRYISPLLLQTENRALRLKENAVLSQYGDDSVVGPGASMSPQTFETTDGRLTWNYFDEAAYVSRGGLREGEDPYVRNRFNQEASDNLPSNRDIPDTRNKM